MHPGTTNNTDIMDKILEKKKGIGRKHIPYLVAGAVGVAVAAMLIFGSGHRMKADASRIAVSDVLRGRFDDYVRITGRVMPINTVQLSAVEGGMVAEKTVEEGSMVRKGDVIVRLENPALSLSILDSEGQLAEKQNFLRNTQVAMEQDKLNLKKERLQLELDVERKKRKYGQYARLYEENLVSAEEYVTSKEDYEYAVAGMNLVAERQKQDSVYRSIQLAQMEESLDNMRRNLTLVRQRVDNLDVKAPVDGQLGLLEVEIGQSVASGGRLGQINVLTDFKVEANIDEHYIDRVKAGLDATFERLDRDFSLRVRKVYPEVREKMFRTDFVFEGRRPDNIRAGQAYSINLRLGQPTEAVMIPRGVFYYVTGGKWIFVVSPDGRRAVRRDIVIGRQNPDYYEVVSGLEPGEKVITSSYEGFGQAKELLLR